MMLDQCVNVNFNRILIEPHGQSPWSHVRRLCGAISLPNNSSRSKAVVSCCRDDLLFYPSEFHHHGIEWIGAGNGGLVSILFPGVFSSMSEHPP